MSTRTLSDLFFGMREVAAGRPELLVGTAEGRREPWSTADFSSAVHSLALTLEELGAQAGDRIAIFSSNRPEWHVVDFACHLLGLVVVPVAPIWGPERVAYVLRNSGSRWVFYEGARERDILAAIRDSLTRVPQAAAFEAEAAVAEGTTLTRLLGHGAERRGQVPLSRFRDRVGPNDLASLVYTDEDGERSGLSPGLLLHHRQLVSATLGLGEVLDLEPRDLSLSSLPLAGLAGRCFDYLSLFRGATLHYAASAEEAIDALPKARPTVLAASGEVFTRLQQGMRAKAEGIRGASWALEEGRRHVAARRRGFVGPTQALRRRLAERLALAELRRPTGGRLRLAVVVGGTAVEATDWDFLTAAGLPLHQGHVARSTSQLLALGSVTRREPGKPLPGIELKVAEEGKVLARGVAIPTRSWQEPAAESATADEGWTPTGIRGRLDAAGELRLVAET